LYTPALMPALNSLIAQQNQQTPVSSAFERSNDLLTQIFRLLNEQQSIPNLPFVSIESERVSSTLAAETDAGSSQIRSEENKENISIAKEESDAAASQQEPISAGMSGWKSNNRMQQQNGKNRNWRLTSMLTDFDVRLDRNIFTPEDFLKFEEFLRTEKQRPEDVRSLSTRSKNEIVMKEYFRNWLHRLLQQLNAASSSLPSNDEEAGYPEEFSKATDEAPVEKIEEQENTNHSTPNESDSSKNDRNIFTEREDSDDQGSFTSATSTSSSQSLKFKQDDATIAEKEESRNENSQN